MGILSSIFGTGATSLVGAVGDAVDKLVTTKEEKMQLDNELKKAAFQYETEMRRLSLAEQEQVYADKRDARAMATSVQTSANASQLSKNVAPYLAIGTTVLTFTLFFTLLFLNALDDTKEKLAYYILGVLSAIVTQIFSFYFGSSSGSSDKNQTIQNLTQKPQ